MWHLLISHMKRWWQRRHRLHSVSHLGSATLVFFLPFVIPVLNLILFDLNSY